MIYIKFKNLAIITIIFALFLTMACVSADDSNQTTTSVISNASDDSPVISEEEPASAPLTANVSSANQTAKPIKA